MSRALRLAVAALLAGGCAGKTPGGTPPRHVTTVQVPAETRAVLDAPDRDPDDRALDRARRPGELLTFFGIRPGMRVAELGAADGYTSELLGRAVGSAGKVFVHNNEWLMHRFAEEEIPRRLAKPVNRHLVKVIRPFDDPFPPEARDLDAVILVFIYHATFWFDGGVDRTKMNAAVRRALKPGGVYGIVDHSAPPGSGPASAERLQRIDERVVRDEVTAAGFELVAEADVLRNPRDTRDWNASPYDVAGAGRESPDAFVLRFEKPGEPR
jgi:predicted methyltransferase